MQKSKPICPMCGQEMDKPDRHHLIPKQKKGSETVDIHRCCHDKIHSIFTNRELERDYNTIEAIKSHPEIQKFIKWLSKRDANLVDPSKMSNKRNPRKRK